MVIHVFSRRDGREKRLPAEKERRRASGARQDYACGGQNETRLIAAEAGFADSLGRAQRGIFFRQVTSNGYWSNPFLSLMGTGLKLAKIRAISSNPFENSVADGFGTALHQR